MLHTNRKKAPKLYLIVDGADDVLGVYSSRKLALQNLKLCDKEIIEVCCIKIRKSVYDFCWDLNER